MIAEQIISDLRSAVSIAANSASAIEFTVPDRNGDGLDDTIRYEWSGVAGAPLLYGYNDQPAQVLANAVHSFNLTYQTVNPQNAPLAEELAVLIYHSDAPRGELKDYGLEQTKWCAQYLLPTFPAGTTTWKIKRVRFQAKADGGDRSGVIKVRTHDGKRLTTTDQRCPR